MLVISSGGRYGHTPRIVGLGTIYFRLLICRRKKLRKIIPISKVTQRIAISPDDKWVFTAEQTKPKLAVIDTGKKEVNQRIELPGVGYGTAPVRRPMVIGWWSPYRGCKKVAFVDLKSTKVTHTVDVPRSPQEVLVRPDGKIAYVSCDASKQVAAIDLQMFRVENLFTAGKGADGLGGQSA